MGAEPRSETESHMQKQCLIHPWQKLIIYCGIGLDIGGMDPHRVAEELASEAWLHAEIDLRPGPVLW